MSVPVTNDLNGITGPMDSISKKALADFSGYYTPRIDACIKEFFNMKMKQATLPFMSECYSHLCEFCLRDGKRIRPLLFIASYRGYKRLFPPARDIISFACAIEIMHAFLLIHDDIIDRSELRRGGKTLHVIAEDTYQEYSLNRNIGNDIAIVLGDILYSNCIEIISTVRINAKIKNRFLQIFANTYEKTGWGQILDSLNTMPRELDAGSDIPSKISELKTAYYTIFYPILMGYVLSGRNNTSEIEAIERFALPLGMAFQYRDDILGTFETDNNTGKSSESDIQEGKFTLLIRETIGGLNSKEKADFSKLFMKRKKSKRDIKRIRAYITATGAFDYVKEQHRDHVHLSMKRLRELNIRKKSREVMNGFIELIDSL